MILSYINHQSQNLNHIIGYHNFTSDISSRLHDDDLCFGQGHGAQFIDEGLRLKQFKFRTLLYPISDG